MKDLNKLEIWDRGMDLADLVYDVINDIPWQKRRRMIDQMSSASLCIPADFAEGNSRHREKTSIDPSNTPRVLLELDTQLIFSARRDRSTVEKIDRAIELCRIG